LVTIATPDSIKSIPHNLAESGKAEQIDRRLLIPIWPSVGADQRRHAAGDGRAQPNTIDVTAGPEKILIPRDSAA
jgi:hypothetical protein